MDEEIILNENATDEEVEQPQTIAYIDVDEPKPIEIAVEEMVGWLSSEANVTHASLPDKHDPNLHPIESIIGLNEHLDKLSSITEGEYSAHGGFAEFRPWLQDEYYIQTVKGTGGVGYFVSLVTADGNTSGGNLHISICRQKNNDSTVGITDVYGVTVDASGFCGYQVESYDVRDEDSANKRHDNDYAMVCLLGNVQVRITDETLDTVKIGDYVVPNELGYAEKSQNNIGFKVLAKGTIESGWNYVSIALVPQNDNISRVMKEIEDTKGTLGNVSLQLGNISNSVDKIGDTTVELSGKVDGFKDILDETVPKVETQLQIAQDASKTAQEIAQAAQESINTVASAYTEALNKSKDAYDALHGVDDQPGVLSDITDIKNNMEPLAKWTGKDGTSGVAGFVAESNKNSTYIATLTQTFTDNGTDLATIIQKSDENGAVIQHLVSHVDKYVLGSTSPINGLSLEETAIMNPGTIYVPTTDEHTETYSDTVSQTFKEGQSYIWQANDTGDYMWAPYKEVSTKSSYSAGNQDGDLWYCWQGIKENNTYIYHPETLYCWDDNKQIWIPVASGDYNSALSIGLINQTAKKFEVAYTDMKENMASLQVKVDSIDATVVNEVKDQISSIHQTAEEIMMGVHNSETSSSLGLLLNGMNSNSTNINVVKIKTVGVAPTSFANFKQCNNAPVWDGTKFIYTVEDKQSGKYYFIPEESTCYYEAVINPNGEVSGYAVYGVNNISMANLNSRVTDTEAEIESWTRFQKGQSETMTSINQTSTESSASIGSMVYGDFRECVHIALNISSDEQDVINEVDKYATPPSWVIITDEYGKEIVDENGEVKHHFQFSGEPVTHDKLDLYNGTYCFLNLNDTSSYYKVLYNSNGPTGYEQYTMKSSSYSSIVQKVDDKGNASIGLVAGNDDAMGSVVVNTINDKSTILIQADKIGIDGTTIFSDTDDYGTTTISGDFIKTGVITSNNYSGPVTYTRFGVLVDTEDNKLVQSSMDTCLYFAPIATGVEYEVLPRQQQYYTALSVNINSDLTALTAPDDIFKSTINGYIVSAEKFELVPLYGTIVGTKFDLNDGTIFSRNLLLDGEGDLTIKGQITATSGYIGDGTNGFTIGMRGLICVATPGIFANMQNYEGSSVLSAPQGTYCFSYDDAAYSFTTTQRIYEGDVITVNINEGNMYINGVFHTKIILGSSDGSLGIIMTESNYYSLWNKQWSYKGNNSRNLGVYIGPDGIGLGNGNFWVDNGGHLTTYGNFEMHTIYDNNDITLMSIENGSLKLTGNITLGGAITWDMTNSPVKSMYSRTYNPSMDNVDDGFVPDYTEWHDAYIIGDMYMTMSFDGGTTWSIPTKIVGTDAHVTPENVFNALTQDGKIQGIYGYQDETNNSMQLYINAEYIRGQTLSGLKFADTKNTMYVQLGKNGFSDVTFYKSKDDSKVFEIREEVGALSFRASGSDKSFLNVVNTAVSAFGTWKFGNNSMAATVDFSETYIIGDLNLYKNGNSNSHIWGVESSDEAVNFYALGDSYMGYNGTQQIAYPKGKWEFSSAYIVGDFSMYKKKGTLTDNDLTDLNSTDRVWGVHYDNDDDNGDGFTDEAVNFYALGDNYLGHNGDQHKTYPKGNWDFSDATVTGLGVVPVFG